MSAAAIIAPRTDGARRAHSRRSGDGRPQRQQPVVEEVVLVVGEPPCRRPAGRLRRVRLVEPHGRRAEPDDPRTSATPLAIAMSTASDGTSRQRASAQRARSADATVADERSVMCGTVRRCHLRMHGSSPGRGALRWCGRSPVHRLVLARSGAPRTIQAIADDGEIDGRPGHAPNSEPRARDVAPLAQRHLLELLERNGVDRARATEGAAR